MTTAPVPMWARYDVQPSVVVPWASVTLQGAHGPVVALLTGCSRGWASVRVETATGPRCEVWPPELVVWESARLLPACTGVRVTLEDGTVHRVGVEDEGLVWSWVRRGLAVGAVVEGER